MLRPPVSCHPVVLHTAYCTAIAIVCLVATDLLCIWIHIRDTNEYAIHPDVFSSHIQSELFTIKFFSHPTDIRCNSYSRRIKFRNPQCF